MGPLRWPQPPLLEEDDQQNHWSFEDLKLPSFVPTANNTLSHYGLVSGNSLRRKGPLPEGVMLGPGTWFLTGDRDKEVAPETLSINMVTRVCLIVNRHYYLFLFFQRTNHSLISSIITSDFCWCQKPLLAFPLLKLLSKANYSLVRMGLITAFHPRLVSSHPLMRSSQSLGKTSKETWKLDTWADK